MTTFRSHMIDLCNVSIPMIIETFDYDPRTYGKITTAISTTYFLLGSVATTLMTADKLIKAYKTDGIGKKELAVAAIGIACVLGCNFKYFGNRS